jgi:hypothetical protein
MRALHQTAAGDPNVNTPAVPIGYASVALGMSRSDPDEFRKLAEKDGHGEKTTLMELWSRSEAVPGQTVRVDIDAGSCGDAAELHRNRGTEGSNPLWTSS